VSTTAATNIIADTLVARQDVIDQAPETMRDFVQGWFEGIEMIKQRPRGPTRRGKGAQARQRDGVGHALGAEAHPYADNAQFYGLAGGKAHYETLFDTAFVIWRKKGLVTRPVDAKDWADTRFLKALAAQYPGSRSRSRAGRAGRRRRDRAIINKQIQIHFTPGSDEIMAGSYFVLDALGETMTSFGNTYLRVEGNTDSTGADGQHDALGAPRAGGEELHPEELPEHPGRRASRRSAAARRTRSRPTPPRRAGSSTAAPTSRSSWRRSRRQSRLPTPDPTIFALREPLPRSTSCARPRRPTSCSGVVRVLRRLRAARLPALAHRGGARHAAAVHRARPVAGHLDLHRRIVMAFLLASALALPLGVLMGAFEPVNRLLRAHHGAAALHADLGVHPAADPLVRHLREAEDRVPLPRRVRLPAAGGGDGHPRGARGAGADGAHARGVAAGRWSGPCWCRRRCPRSSTRSA
jgi:outer membrane protein OmpA-like peptidoglycan-associated protein